MWKPEVHLLIKIKILCDSEEKFFLTVHGNGFQEGCIGTYRQLCNTLQRCTRVYSLHKLIDNLNERAMNLKLTGGVIMCN